jgi:HAD superfamily hydrolase (TIGR01509 family)
MTPKTPPVRAVVFDLDGLMFNTEVVFTATGTELLRRRGKVPHPQLFTRMMGRRAPEAFAIMIELMELSESYDELKGESEIIFYEVLDEMLAPMPGLFTLLERIEAAGLPKGVATSSSRAYLTNLLSRFTLLDRFDVTLGAEDVTHGKPHPEIYLAAADRLQVAPAAMMVLEDSEAGTRAAASAGAQVFSIPHEQCRDHDYSMATAIAASLDDPVILDRIAL